MKAANFCNLPSITLTAYARADDRQRALLAGFQMHVSKPVEPRELIAGIASLLNLSAAEPAESGHEGIRFEQGARDLDARESRQSARALDQDPQEGFRPAQRHR